jgi:hypothetical protein
MSAAISRRKASTCSWLYPRIAGRNRLFSISSGEVPMRIPPPPKNTAATELFRC